MKRFSFHSIRRHTPTRATLPVLRPRRALDHGGGGRRRETDERLRQGLGAIGEEVHETGREGVLEDRLAHRHRVRRHGLRRVLRQAHLRADQSDHSQFVIGERRRRRDETARARERLMR